MKPVFVWLAFLFLIQTPFVGRVSRRHEFEADLEAVKMGASGPALISAIQKIITLSGVDPSQKHSAFTRIAFGMIHPTLDEREAMLKRGSIPSEEHTQPFARYAYVFAIILTLQLSFSYFNPAAPKIAAKTQAVPERSVASEIKNQ